MKNLLTLALVTLSLSTVACNGTKHAVCSEQNAIEVPGFIGRYTISVQDDKFVTHTQEVNIEADSEFRGKMKFKKDKSASGDDMFACMIGGKYIVEAVDTETTEAFQAQLAVTGTGLSFYPIQYDASALDEARIPYTIVEIPNTFANKFKSFAKRNSEESAQVMIVDNTGVKPERLFKAASASPLGFTLFRK